LLLLAFLSVAIGYIDKREGGEYKVPSFTDNKVDQAYENFMEQVLGFQRDPPEAKTIEKDIQKEIKKQYLAFS